MLAKFELWCYKYYPSQQESRPEIQQKVSRRERRLVVGKTRFLCVYVILYYSSHLHVTCLRFLQLLWMVHHGDPYGVFYDDFFLSNDHHEPSSCVVLSLLPLFQLSGIFL
jgi:hypothetical protein